MSAVRIIASLLVPVASIGFVASPAAAMQEHDPYEHDAEGDKIAEDIYNDVVGHMRRVRTRTRTGSPRASTSSAAVTCT